MDPESRRRALAAAQLLESLPNHRHLLLVRGDNRHLALRALARAVSEHLIDLLVEAHDQDGLEVVDDRVGGCPLLETVRVKNAIRAEPRLLLLIRFWPSFDNTCRVHESALVELLAGKLANLRVHAVLHGEQQRLGTELVEAFKERTLERNLLRVFRDDGGRKLLRITHQHASPGAVQKRDQRRHLIRLGGLVDEHGVETVCELPENFPRRRSQSREDNLRVVDKRSLQRRPHLPYRPLLVILHLPVHLAVYALISRHVVRVGAEVVEQVGEPGHFGHRSVAVLVHPEYLCDDPVTLLVPRVDLLPRFHVVPFRRYRSRFRGRHGQFHQLVLFVFDEIARLFHEFRVLVELCVPARAVELFAIRLSHLDEVLDQPRCRHRAHGVAHHRFRSGNAHHRGGVEFPGELVKPLSDDTFQQIIHRRV